MRFHVVSLPHTQTTKAYSHCAYTEKVRKFCDMMMARGHEVFLYAGEENEANCTDHIVCITKNEQRELIGVEGPADNLKAEFDPNAIYWQLMNAKAARAIKENAKPQDFVCLIAGRCQQQIATALPDLMSVEFGIGYGGTFSPYRVFESYAWMHMVYGAQSRDPHTADGNAFDAVIPNYYDPEEFPYSEEKEDYFLYMGRLTARKGYEIASDVCERLGERLLVAGQGDAPKYGEYLGLVGPEQRGELLSKAKAVFVPTQYVEPFGGIAAEAMLCGTPIITTDWGAFVEYNVSGVTGYRCRTLADFMHAVQNVDRLKPQRIHNIAKGKFSMKVVGQQYESYFERLLTLWEDGWYTLPVGEKKNGSNNDPGRNPRIRSNPARG